MAFYTGNDPRDSFKITYARDRWRDLRPNADLSKETVPEFKYPPPKAEQVKVRFPDGFATVFTPSLRYASNGDYQAVHAGHEIMAEAARRMAAMASEKYARAVFTIIPTKELVHARKVELDQIRPGNEYLELVAAEGRNLRQLASVLSGLSNAVYVDVLGPLQTAALGTVRLYRRDNNGHPVPDGYGIIGDALLPAVDDALPARPRGLVRVIHQDRTYVLLIRNGEVWSFDSDELRRKNGWEDRDIRTVTVRDVGTLPIAGRISTVDEARFGP